MHRTDRAGCLLRAALGASGVGRLSVVEVGQPLASFQAPFEERQPSSVAFVAAVVAFLAVRRFLHERTVRDPLFL